MSKAFPCVDVIVHQMRRHLGAFLAVLALSVQSLIPTGYMVGARGETDGFAITLCTSNGMVNAVMNDNGQITELGAGNKARSDVPQPDDDHTKSVCGFAAQSIALFGPTSFELTRHELAFEALVAPLFASLTTPGRGLAAPPPPKTGPPLQA
jgi:hypothetical protein